MSGVICGYIPMMKTSLPFLTFPLAGLCYGICSGFSVILQPLGIIAPGIFFGLALVYSFDASVTLLSAGKRATIIAASTCGYIIAIVASLLSARLPGFDNGLLYGVYAGTIAGGVGAIVVATSLAVVVSALSPVRTLLIVTLAGSIFGAGFMYVGIYISDRTPFGHPFDDFVSFPLWHAGVASVVPLRTRSSNAQNAT
jgi:hypothetical protein